jgi:hypothetical protein
VSRKSRIALVVVGLIVVILVGVILIDPPWVVLGVLRGEAFYRWHPTSYWQEIIAKDGASGKLSQTTIDAFGHDPQAVPVLKECLTHEDANVRWPSVLLLHRCAFYRDEVTECARLLDDPDAQVRWEAIKLLGMLHRESLSALPRLSALAGSQDIQIAVAARFALWDIDPPTAEKVEGWNTFTSKRWEFSISLPGRVQSVDSKHPMTGQDVHQFKTSCGLSHLMVVVSAAAPDARNSTEQAYKFMSDALGTALGGTVSRCEQIRQSGHIGREFLVDMSKEHMVFQSRVFVIGDRVYQAVLAYQPESLHPDAVKHFFDSFVISWNPPKPIPSGVKSPAPNP